MSEIGSLHSMAIQTKARALDKREYLVIIRDKYLLILHKNICCDSSSEPSRRDSSDEGSQHYGFGEK